MLTKVIIENYRSFKNREEFNLKSTKYQILQETNVCNGILKSALIVGPNATGKSTLINAIKTLLDLLFSDNFTIQPIDACLFCDKKNIHLEYHFLIDNKNIEYSFEADQSGKILTENLLIDKKVILERHALGGRIFLDGEPAKVMDKLFTERVLLLRKCYFSDIFSSSEIIKDLMNFLRHSVYVNAHDKVSQSYDNVTHLIQNVDDSTLGEINNIFTKMNIGFTVSKKTEIRAGNFEKLSSKSKGIVFRSTHPVICFERHNMNFSLPLELESLGNQTLINIFPSILYCCKNDCILLIDEFSSGFHNKLEELIIKFFLSNSKRSQMIFTSHSTNLCDTRLLRPDQIYTVNFKPNEGSFIERFSNENPREAQNLEKMYLSGKFGSLPNYKF